MNIYKAIENEKSKLINKAKNNGLYENFGQKEVRKLENRYINISDYSQRMNENRNAIIQFDEWCMNYCG